MIRILQIPNHRDIKQIMQDIGVDPYGIGIMQPKAIHYLMRMNSISNIAANILKQEMLSLGGEVAVARGALTGKIKKTDCLLMGSLSQFNRLNQKLNKQPFGLDKLAQDLCLTLKNYQRDNFVLNLGRYKLNLGSRVHIMGIVNLTPDSFSGDGLLGKWQMANGKWDKEFLIEHAQRLINDGADIIDVGGESSQPGAKPVSIKEELARTIPVIKLLIKRIKVPISIDTHKPEVARLALDNGAMIVNDITALRDPKMARLVAGYKAGLVIMHMKGNPRTMQKNPQYVSLLDEITEFLQKAINRAREFGIDKEKIIIDPGIGFGKTCGHNLEILKRLSEFKVLGRPILIGPSRKSFIGKILNAGPKERIFGTVSACVLAAKNGARVVRVHDVKAVKQALKIFEATDG
jgi:dihydropteroate synthase